MSLDIGLPLEPLRQPIRSIVNRESDHYEVLLAARNRRGRAIQCHVICTPLLGALNDIKGVILLMEERAQQE